MKVCVCVFFPREAVVSFFLSDNVGAEVSQTNPACHLQASERFTETITRDRTLIFQISP